MTGKWWHKLYQVKLRRSSTITLEKVRSQSWPGSFRWPGGHYHVRIYEGCYSAHVPSWPLAMCRRARHASLQRTAWAEYCTEQPCLVGTGRSAQHVQVPDTISPPGKPTSDADASACLLKEPHCCVQESIARWLCLQERWRDNMVDLVLLCAGHTRVRCWPEELCAIIYHWQGLNVQQYRSIL